EELGTGNAGGIDCVWDGTTTSGTCISGDILSTTRVVLKSVYPAGITISWGPGCDIETSTTCTIISLDSDVIIEPVFLGPPPDPFTFDDQINVPLNTVINSNTITVSGLILPAVISITACSSPSCEYSVNNSGWTSLPGTVNNGDTVTVRQVSSGGNFTTTDLTLSVGGATDTFSVRTIPNYPPPVAQFLLWPDLTTSYEIHFDATSSTCTSTPCTYSWDFGDGSSGSGMTTSHTYADGTTVTVTLTVTDAYLLSAGASQSVVPTPVNLPPTVSSTAPSISNYTISLADTSSDAPGNNPSGFLPGAVTITWGDGAQSAGNASGTFTHTYAAASVYAIIHTIRNAVGLWASEKMKVRVPEKFSISVATTPALTGTSLYVKTSGGSTIKYCTTSLTGSCVFTNLLPNTYKIQAYKSRYAFDGDPVTPGNQNPVNVTVGPDRTVNFNHTP
ncbi:MAG: PKD domain-containing protein, partial [Nitrospirae bacterium]|nr:PKD domain-containing protein [Nitrospirota bacterium]